MPPSTHIEILVAPGCSSHQQTVELVAELLKEASLQAQISETVVQDVPQALKHRFLGSPSVRVNGVDVEPDARELHQYGMG